MSVKQSDLHKYLGCLHECDAYGEYALDQEEPSPALQTVMSV
jgi:hypothetical protein